MMHPVLISADDKVYHGGFQSNMVLVQEELMFLLCSHKVE